MQETENQALSRKIGWLPVKLVGKYLYLLKLRDVHLEFDELVQARGGPDAFASCNGHRYSFSLRPEDNWQPSGCINRSTLWNYSSNVSPIS